MSEHVSLLKDMKSGINCRLEAIAAIESLEATVADLEQQLTAANAERQWIPVSERLPRPHIDSVYIWPRPDFGNEVHTGILTSTAKDAEIAWYVSDYIANYGKELVKVKVTHWMPIPQPPEGEE